MKPVECEPSGDQQRNAASSQDYSRESPGRIVIEMEGIKVLHQKAKTKYPAVYKWRKNTRYPADK